MIFKKKLNKTTVLFILIFLLGLFVIGIYINNSFNENGNHTSTPSSQVETIAS
jgi:preprotein translocase subunit SecG